MTNDIEIIREDITFHRCEDYLQAQYGIVQNGYILQSEVKKSFQRNVEHKIRYKKQGQIKQFRLLVDQRTGDVQELETEDILTH